MIKETRLSFLKSYNHFFTLMWLSTVQQTKREFVINIRVLIKTTTHETTTNNTISMDTCHLQRISKFWPKQYLKMKGNVKKSRIKNASDDDNDIIIPSASHGIYHSSIQLYLNKMQLNFSSKTIVSSKILSMRRNEQLIIIL